MKKMNMSLKINTISKGNNKISMVEADPCIGVDTFLLPNYKDTKMFLIPDGKYLTIQKEINGKHYKLKVKTYYSIVFDGHLHKLKARLDGDNYYFSFCSEDGGYIFIIYRKRISLFDGGMKITFKTSDGIFERYDDIPYNYYPIR